MSAWYALPTALLVCAMLASAVRKATRAAPSEQLRLRLGVRRPAWTVIGLLEAAAVLGTAAGLVVPALGVAAASGAALLMLGAVVAHLRADLSGRVLLPPTVVALCAVLAAVGFATA